MFCPTNRLGLLVRRSDVTHSLSAVEQFNTCHPTSLYSAGQQKLTSFLAPEPELFQKNRVQNCDQGG